jgi:transposase
MIIAPGFVGIDVSKHHLDIFDAAVGIAARRTNTAAAVAELAHDWARRDAFVLFEATGCYDLDLRHALTAAGVRFARVNPARARDFARAAGFLAKTDAVDAEMLAAMAQCLQLPPAKAGLAAREQLAALNRRRDQLVANRQQERTRQRECPDPFSRQSIAAHLVWLDAAIKAIQAQIAAAIAAEPELEHDRRLLSSAPGVGPVTAATLLALMPELGRRSPKQLAALAGLAPFNNDSGTRRGQRSIRGGRKRVRDALYVAAFIAARHAPRFKAFFKTLIDAGKPRKLAVIAVARKLLTVLNAILRDRQPFHA